jgi:nucleoside-diphosphate-sugar epimerase
MTTRREFIGASIAMLGSSRLAAESMLAPASRPLEILFLGGTGFIGPHQINYALDRGHTVTMFNRGRNSGLYGDQVEELVGNRDSNIDDGLAVLQGKRRWDVVVDNSGYVPRHVRDAVELLKDRTDLYIYTSTRGVYDFANTDWVDTSGPLLPAPTPFTEQVNGDTYGPLKAECDRIVQQVMGERAAIVRPPYIVGPGDTTDRFTYWVERLHRGGDVLCPAGPDIEVQWIDARDLCRFIVTLAENRTSGIFNTAGPASVMNNKQLMHGLRAFATEPVQLYWPTQAVLDDAGFNPLMFGSRPKSVHVDPSSAIAAGMRYTSLADTVRDTHEWWQTQPVERRSKPRNWPDTRLEASIIAGMRGAA